MAKLVLRNEVVRNYNIADIYPTKDTVCTKVDLAKFLIDCTRCWGRIPQNHPKAVDAYVLAVKWLESKRGNLFKDPVYKTPAEHIAALRSSMIKRGYQITR